MTQQPLPLKTRLIAYLTAFLLAVGYYVINALLLVLCAVCIGLALVATLLGHWFFTVILVACLLAFMER